jgi:hypothetical protein
VLSGGNIDIDLFNRWIVAESVAMAGSEALV